MIRLGRMATDGEIVLNDIHSKLNATRMRRIVAPNTLEGLRQAIMAAADAGETVSIAGGRHAMGGQQFLSGGTLLDMRRLNRILDLDAERGLVRVEAGMLWSDLVAGLRSMQRGRARRWSVIQKQTGADRLSIGGALAANGHGRGLAYKPIVQDIEAFELVDARGELRRCSRSENADLFGLAIGGYGLFGAIYSVTLRLMAAHRLRRVVDLTTVDRLEALFAERIAAGFTYGDFQYMTDETADGFLREGVLSCYLPLAADEQAPDEPPRYTLSERDWRGLLQLSHADKARAFREYAAFYTASSGQVYDSDTFQLSMYIDDYHAELDGRLPGGGLRSETITELYVPLGALADFMAAARELRHRRANVIYGTIRLIERDDETFLNWARRRYACIVFNLCVEHTDAGVAAGAAALRGLIDLARERGGSYFLTYNRYATAAQLSACYPQFGEFLAHKDLYDPDGVFSSDWHRAYRDLAQGRF